MPNREHEQGRNDGNPQHRGRDDREFGGEFGGWGGYGTSSRGLGRQDYGQYGRDDERWGRGERWGHDMDRGERSRDWSRADDWRNRGDERYGREWSPYDRFAERQDFRQHSFGFGGTDRGFGGGGYGGYGGYGERGYGMDRGWGERGYGMERGYGGRGYTGVERGWGGMERGYGGADRGYYGMDRGYGAMGEGYGRGGWDRDLDERPRGGFGYGVGGMDLGWEHRGYGQDLRWGGPQPRRGRAPRGYQRSDERIKEDLCDRLMQSWIDAENVDIQVQKGEVTLTGTVDDRQAKRAIEDLAEQILGVKDVQNHIRVAPHDERQGQVDKGATNLGASNMSASGKKPTA